MNAHTKKEGYDDEKRRWDRSTALHTHETIWASDKREKKTEPIIILPCQGNVIPGLLPHPNKGCGQIRINSVPQPLTL